MIRSSLTTEEVDLLVNLRNACQAALRVGLADSNDRERLGGLAERVDPMLKKIERGT